VAAGAFAIAAMVGSALRSASAQPSWNSHDQPVVEFADVPLSPNRRNHMKCCNRIQPAPGVAPEAISRRYEAALQGEEGGIVAATGGARFARYEPRAGVSPSPEMLESSFGCGDPVAISGLRHGQTVLDLGSGGDSIWSSPPRESALPAR
jgi:hypothetical protein